MRCDVILMAWLRLARVGNQRHQQSSSFHLFSLKKKTKKKPQTMQGAAAVLAG